MGIKESDIEDLILTWLNIQPGVFAFKVVTGGFYDSKRGFYRKNKSKFILRGTSDILGIANGRFFAIEVKTPIGMKRFIKAQSTVLMGEDSHELNQVAFIERINYFGGFAFAASSLQDVADRFNAEFKLNK